MISNVKFAKETLLGWRVSLIISNFSQQMENVQQNWYDYGYFQKLLYFKVYIMCRREQAHVHKIGPNTN